MIVDDYDFFCEKQELKESAYSFYSVAIPEPCDWGHRATPLYVNIMILGPHDQDLTVDLIARKGEKDTPVTIATTGVVKKTELVYGKCLNLPVPPMDLKYKELALVFKRAGVAPQNPPDSGATCPTAPFLEPKGEIANGVTALLSNNFKGTVTYPYANEDKIYTSQS